MAGIGGITCTFVKGTVNAPKERVETWQAPGVNGYGAQRLGQGDAPFAFRGIAMGSASAVEAWFVFIEALQGQIVSIVDDWGVTYPSLLVQQVTRVDKAPAFGLDPSGVAFQCRGEIEVRGVKTQ